MHDPYPRRVCTLRQSQAEGYSVNEIVRRFEGLLGFGWGHLPPLVVAFVVAELFYKFHSFTLECGAFLVTWRLLDWGYQFVARRLQRPAASTASA